METQKELVRLVLQAKAGRQVELKDLAKTVAEWLSSSTEELKTAGLQLVEESRGSVKRSYEVFNQVFR
jgi:3-deoxy-D-manno-octulosonic-acid transferase